MISLITGDMSSISEFALYEAIGNVSYAVTGISGQKSSDYRPSPTVPAMNAIEHTMQQTPKRGAKRPALTLVRPQPPQRPLQNAPSNAISRYEQIQSGGSEFTITAAFTPCGNSITHVAVTRPFELKRPSCW